MADSSGTRPLGQVRKQEGRGRRAEHVQVPLLFPRSGGQLTWERTKRMVEVQRDRLGLVGASFSSTKNLLT